MEEQDEERDWYYEQEIIKEIYQDERSEGMSSLYS